MGDATAEWPLRRKRGVVVYRIPITAHRAEESDVRLGHRPSARTLELVTDGELVEKLVQQVRSFLSLIGVPES